MQLAQRMLRFNSGNSPAAPSMANASLIMRRDRDQLASTEFNALARSTEIESAARSVAKKQFIMIGKFMA